MEKLRILVVDDEPIMTRTLARVLSEYQVTEASSGAAALRLIDEGARFDAIISDVRMPEMQGPEFLEELVRRDVDQAKRLVFLSSTTDLHELPATLAVRRFAELAGPHLTAKPFVASPRLLRKPFDISVLRYLVARIAARPSFLPA